MILFGSGAQGEMTAESDLDLLVIEATNGAPTTPARQELWRYPGSGDQIHVVVTGRAVAEKHRRSASYVQGAALEEGRTVYIRAGVTPLQTGPTRVGTTLYEPDQALELLDRRPAAEAQAPPATGNCDARQAGEEDRRRRGAPVRRPPGNGVAATPADLDRVFYRTFGSIAPQAPSWAARSSLTRCSIRTGGDQARRSRCARSDGPRQPSRPVK